jgi:hypothetical protein
MRPKAGRILRENIRHYQIRDQPHSLHPVILLPGVLSPESDNSRKKGGLLISCNERGTSKACRQSFNKFCSHHTFFSRLFAEARKYAEMNSFLFGLRAVLASFIVLG